MNYHSDDNTISQEEFEKFKEACRQHNKAIYNSPPLLERVVPFFVYETEVARNERTTRRLIIALVIAIILLFISNALWLYAWTQYDYSSDAVTYSQDGEGFNNINTGEQGDIYGTDTDD